MNATVLLHAEHPLFGIVVYLDLTYVTGSRTPHFWYSGLPRPNVCDRDVGPDTISDTKISHLNVRALNK